MRRRYRSRGFTLIELMIVVTMIGVLSALALVGYRKYLKSAKISEPIAVAQGIRAAQEAYRAETMQYLNVSTSATTYYPRSSGFDSKKLSWDFPGADGYSNWRTLAVTVDGPVAFGYACVAGNAGSAVMPAIDGAFTFSSSGGQPPAFPNPSPEPWYFIQAKGDPTASGKPTVLLGHSFTGELYWENE